MEPCSLPRRDGYIRPKQEPTAPCAGQPVMLRDGAVNCGPGPLRLIKEKKVYARPFLECCEGGKDSQLSLPQGDGVTILAGSKPEI